MPIRETNQRQAIREAFEHANRPLSTSELLAEAQRIHPGLGIATAYRTVKLFLAQGVLRTVRTPDAPPRYELADRPVRHYFYCTNCGCVAEVPCCGGHNVTSLVPAGYEIDSHDMVLYGLCPRCQEDPHVPTGDCNGRPCQSVA